MKKPYRIQYRMRLLDDSGWTEWMHSRSYTTLKAMKAGLESLNASRQGFEYRPTDRRER